MSKRSIVAVVALVIAVPAAHANGESGPMVGGGIVATDGRDADVAGVTAELVLWHGPLALAVEGAQQWAIPGVDSLRVSTLGASLRLLAFEHIIPSLLDTREVVALGIELQGIVERAWWDDTTITREPVSYGLGLAVRLRGATDDDRSNLLAESRFFVRASWAREDDDAFAARDRMPAPAPTEGVTIVVGLGALFGMGRSGYVEQLRRNNALDSEWLVR